MSDFNGGKGKDEKYFNGGKGKDEKYFNFFCGGWDLNPGPCIYYALSQPTEISS
jgi:hypothetical protein